MSSLVNATVRKEIIGEATDWKPEIGFAEGFKASFDLASSTTRDLLQYSKQQQINTGELLDPEIVQEKYPFIEKKFNEPVPEDRAKFMNEEGLRRYRLNKIKEQGLGTGLGAAAIDFINGVGMSLTDPIELGVNTVTGFGVGMLGAKLASSTAVNMGTKAAKYVMTKPVAKEIAENVAGSVLLEPGYAYLQDELKREYTVMDSITNIAVGSTAFTGAKLAAKSVWKYGKGTYVSVSNKLKGAELNDNVARIKEGIAPTDVRTRQALDELNTPYTKNVDFDADTSAYTHTYWSPQTKMYAAYDVNYDKSTPFGHYFGDDFLYVSSDPNRAHQLTSDKFNDNATVVRKYDLTEMNILDADEGFETAMDRLGQSGALDRMKGKLDKIEAEINNSKNFDEFLTKIREGIDEGKYTDDDLHNILRSLEESGFDGVKMSMDGAGNPHHGVFIFPEARKKAKIEADFDAKKEMYNDLSSRYKNEIESDLNKPIYPEQDVEPVKALTEDQVDAEVDNYNKSALEALSILEKKDLLPENVKKDFELAQNNLKDVEAMNKKLTNYIDCLTKNFK